MRPHLHASESRGLIAKRLGIIPILLLSTISLSFPAASAAITQERDADRTSEYNLKAVLIWHLIQFTNWPESAKPESTLIIGVYKENPFGKALRNVTAEKSVGGRRLVVLVVNTIDDIEECDVLFIPNSHRSDVERITKAQHEKPLLTIGESSDLSRLGIIINFFISQNKVRFEVNLDAAERAGFRFTSRMLSAARIFREDE